MKKQEFLNLYNQADDISAKKVSKILMEYCDTTSDFEVHSCMNTLDTLMEVSDYMEQMEKLDMAKKPYTIQDAIKCLQMRILRIYIDSLEE